MMEGIRRAMERFPDLAHAIKQYGADNRFFRGLCEDYGEAVEVLQRWEPLRNSPEEKHLRSCRELVEDLEREILLELDHWNQP